MSWQSEICSRCCTTHPANENGERICPKPPKVERPEPDNPFESILYVWKCGGATRGFERPGLPKVQGLNPGHTPPTSAMLGLTPAQEKKLGL
jgi:hypothetical protein